MKKVQQGFTLIELMIVVAIIGILAAIAIPAYQDYIARSQVSEALALMDGAKTPAAEFYADKGSWPVGTSFTALVPVTSGKYVASISGSVASSVFTLQATMKSSGVNANIQSGTVRLTTADGGTWTCSAGASNGIASNYLPGACK